MQINVINVTKVTSM